MKIIAGLFLISVLFSSCQSKKSDDRSDNGNSLPEMEAEIMRIHDEVMPKVTDINRMSSQLRDIKSKAGKTPEGVPVEIEGLDETLEALRQAEQGMMDWMKNYGDVKALTPDDKLPEFYKQELEKIKAVRIKKIVRL